METLAADFYLAFQAGKVVLRIVGKALVSANHDEPLDRLGQHKLMMKGNVSPSILKRKNYPDSQRLRILP